MDENNTFERFFFKEFAVNHSGGTVCITLVCYLHYNKKITVMYLVVSTVRLWLNTSLALVCLMEY